MLAEPTAARALGARCHAVLDQPRQAAHRRIGAPAAQAGPGVVELPDDAGAATTRSVTYDVSRLMRLSAPKRFLVTLGGRDHVDPASVHRRDDLHHPLYTPESVAAQRLLPTLDDDRVVFAGRLPRLGIPRGRRRIGTARRAAPAARPRPRPDRGVGMTTGTPRSTAPASRTCGAHRCTTTSSYQSYSWYVDIDDLPVLPAECCVRSRGSKPATTSSRHPVPDRHPAQPGRRVPGRDGTSPAGRPHHRADAGPGARLRLQPAEPVFWCHDADGVLRAIIAEVHNTYGQRHGYLLPPDDEQAARWCPRRCTCRRSTRSTATTWCVHHDPTITLDVTISLHRDNQPAFVATLRGERRKAGAAQVARLQVTAPVAPLMGALRNSRPGHHAVAASGAPGAAPSDRPSASARGVLLSRRPTAIVSRRGVSPS